MTMILDGSNGLTMPNWTTANRPTTPIIGAQGYNTTYGGVEVYNGSAWTLVTGGPAFSVYQSSAQSITNASFTKLQFQTKEFDTNNCFDASTNYRFTPTVAGYYQINAAVYISSSTTLICSIFKNGSVYKQGGQSAGTAGQAMAVSSIVYCNGSTDYIEIYCYQGLGSSQNTDAAINHTYVNGSFVRGQ
jgi:hypothetical protein